MYCKPLVVPVEPVEYMPGRPPPAMDERRLVHCEDPDEHHAGDCLAEVDGEVIRWRGKGQ